MRDTVVRERIAVRLQRFVVAVPERFVERLERGVDLVALHEDPRPGGGDQHVLVVAETL